MRQWNFTELVFVSGVKTFTVAFELFIHLNLSTEQAQCILRAAFKAVVKY